MKSKGLFCVRNLVISFVVFIGVLFLINGSPYGLAKLSEITDGPSILDMEMMKGYSVDRAYEMLDALGEEGRAFNLKYIVPLDLVFPLTYGLFYFIALTMLLKSIWKGVKRPWLIGLVGVCATVFDYLENFMVIRLLNHYPERLEGVVKISSVFTQLKSLFVTGSMLLIGVGVVVVLVKRVFMKRVV